MARTILDNDGINLRTGEIYDPINYVRAVLMKAKEEDYFASIPTLRKTNINISLNDLRRTAKKNGITLNIRSVNDVSFPADANERSWAHIVRVEMLTQEDIPLATRVLDTVRATFRNETRVTGTEETAVGDQTVEPTATVFIDISVRTYGIRKFSYGVATI